MNGLNKRLDDMPRFDRIVLSSFNKCMTRRYSPSPEPFVADFKNNSMKLGYGANTKLYWMVRL